jgi:hypothetical protein
MHRSPSPIPSFPSCCLITFPSWCLSHPPLLSLSPPPMATLRRHAPPVSPLCTTGHLEWMAHSSLPSRCTRTASIACSDLSGQQHGWGMVGVHNLSRLHALVFHSLRAIGPIVLWFPPLSAICRTTLLTCIDPCPTRCNIPTHTPSMLPKKQ